MGGKIEDIIGYLDGYIENIDKLFRTAENRPSFICGSRLYTMPNDNTSCVLFTLSQLLSIFNTPNAEYRNFYASVMNGDAVKTAAHFDGATWINGNTLHALFDRTISAGTKIRINYVIMYSPTYRASI